MTPQWAELTLQIVTKPVQLLQHEVNVRLRLGLVGDDAAEEVWKFSERLVADHHAAGLHHTSLGGRQCRKVVFKIEKYSINICQNAVRKFF